LFAIPVCKTEVTEKWCPENEGPYHVEDQRYSLRPIPSQALQWHETQILCFQNIAAGIKWATVAIIFAHAQIDDATLSNQHHKKLP
jgi:hypothetical protein